MSVPLYEVHRDRFTVSTDPDRLDLDRICGWLADAYWSRTRTRATIVRSIAHSLCFGVYAPDRQVAFARVTTDFATVAYLGDVVVDPAYRGDGLGVWLVEAILAHPELQGLRRWLLATQDAHGLYARFGFTPLAAPERWMERFDPSANPPIGSEQPSDGGCS